MNDGRKTKTYAHDKAIIIITRTQPQKTKRAKISQHTAHCDKLSHIIVNFFSEILYLNDFETHHYLYESNQGSA